MIILILPIFIGVDGIVYAGPVADLMAACVGAVLVIFEFKDMKKLEQKQNE